ncbi:tRNA (guanosine(37)-N1)-methyltransferase TrmD [Candidatus Giovannonibacteria bacterium]|nr:tRNA (guanosine(37)-N1)-methyltransferase TrmD [Candidatus Giovannonibacteria bacterium]
MSKISFNIITIFPKIFDSYFSESIIKRAVEKKKVAIKIHNLRDFSADKKHHKVDDRPFGGGAGMVLMAEPILHAVKKAQLGNRESKLAKVVIFSAKGKQFNQKMAYDWSRKYNNFIFITGRYEGIDERVTKILKAEEISIGPYITTDGDVAAMIVVSAITRLIPNVINWSSLEDESFFRKTLHLETEFPSGSSVSKKLEYPHYTRPEKITWKGKRYKVPNVLLSGNHAEIEKWRNKNRK